MKRRDFVVSLGAAAVGAFAARAQPASPVIGFLSARSPVESAGLVAAFRRGLAENGTIEGLNVAIDYRWALGEYGRLPAMAWELVKRPVAVFVTVGGEAAARAAIAATKNIPIIGIFADDPVASGLVASLNRPGGNTTGVFNFNPSLGAKRLGLLAAIGPSRLRRSRIGAQIVSTKPACGLCGCRSGEGSVAKSVATMPTSIRAAMHR